MEGQEKKNNGVIIGTVAVLVLLVAVYGYYSYSNKTSTVPEVAVTPTVTVSPIVTTAPANKFKDGSYSATGNYNSPGGAEEIGVNVTVKGDVITDASVKVMATRPVSKNFQTIVSTNIKSLVVGKKLNDVVLDKVSGSSLTPKGWNDAISKIESQARA